MYTFVIDTHVIGEELGGNGNAVIVTFLDKESCCRWIWLRLYKSGIQNERQDITKLMLAIPNACFSVSSDEEGMETNSSMCRINDISSRLEENKNKSQVSSARESVDFSFNQPSIGIQLSNVSGVQNQLESFNQPNIGIQLSNVSGVQNQLESFNQPSIGIQLSNVSGVQNQLESFNQPSIGIQLSNVSKSIGEKRHMKVV